MQHLSFICLLLVFNLLTIVNTEDNDDDSCYTNVEKVCSYYDYEECARNCTHDKFPQQTLKEIFRSNNVELCCAQESSYTFHYSEECEVYYSKFS